MKKGFLSNFVSDIKQRKNLELYITLIIILGVVLAGLFKVNTEAILMDLVLMTLALLLYTVVDLRRTNEEVTQKLAQITTRTSAQNFFHTWNLEPFQKSLAAAKKELCMYAVANSIFLSSNTEQIEEFLSRGGIIKCILMDPKPSVLITATEAFVGFEKNPQEIKKQIEYSLKILSTFAKKFPGQVEVRLTKHVPSSIITIVDRNEKNGIMFVTLKGFEQEAYNRPSFILEKSDSERWFDFYESSFQNLWKWQNTRPIDLSTYAKQ